MKATPKPSRNHPLKLHRLARRLEAWRTTSTRGRRIPERLWQAAAELARVHGLSATASALKLNYYDLQRRLGSNLAVEAENPVRPQFVQLSAGGPSWPGTDPGTVELLQPSGARLILRLPKSHARQLLPLVQALLRA
jgi:hypothetical protein